MSSNTVSSNTVSSNTVSSNTVSSVSAVPAEDVPGFLNSLTPKGIYLLRNQLGSYKDYAIDIMFSKITFLHQQRFSTNMPENTQHYGNCGSLDDFLNGYVLIDDYLHRNFRGNLMYLRKYYQSRNVRLSEMLHISRSGSGLLGALILLNDISLVYQLLQRINGDIYIPDLFYTSREMVMLISNGQPTIDFLAGALTPAVVNYLLIEKQLLIDPVVGSSENVSSYGELLMRMIRTEAIERTLELRGSVPTEGVSDTEEILVENASQPRLFRFWLDYFSNLHPTILQRVFLRACDNTNNIISPKVVRYCIEAGVNPNGSFEDMFDNRTAISLLIGNYIVLDFERPALLKSINYLLDLQVDLNIGNNQDLFGADSTVYSHLDDLDVLHLYQKLLCSNLHTIDENLRRAILGSE